MPRKKIKGFGIKMTCLIAAIFCIALEAYGYFYIPSNKKISNRNRLVLALYNNNYGNLETDGKWNKWNQFTHRRETERFDPPNFIPSIYSPYLGIYSSNDKAIIKEHFEMLEYANIDGIIVPYRDSKLKHNDQIKNETSKSVNLNSIEFQSSINDLFLTAFQYKIKIGILINARCLNSSQVSILIQKYLETYHLHPSLLKYKDKPVVFVNNPNGISFDLSTKNKVFIILYSEKKYFLPSLEIANGFAQTEIPFNSTEYEIARTRNHKIIPIVSPGYNESAQHIYALSTAISRKGGKTYDQSWEEALKWGDDIVLINSFNEFFMGTEIEPVSITSPDFNTWGPADSYFYLKRTAFWADRFHTL